jgi:flagellar biosynthetic protein FliP
VTPAPPTAAPTRPGLLRRPASWIVLALLVITGWLLLSVAVDSPASAVTLSGTAGPTGPEGPSDPDTVTVELEGLTDKPSTPVVTILALTLLSVAPAVLLTCTSFTKILVVLGLTRNALGLQQTPPNQVLAGLALFLSLFVMAPVLGAVDDAGVQPYLDGSKSASAAYTDGVEPLKEFMLDNTDDDELELLTQVAEC